MVLSKFVFWRHLLWKRPKLFIAILSIGAVASIALYLQSPEEALNIHSTDPGSDPDDYKSHPFYAVGFLIFALIGYMIASGAGRRDGDAFKSPYT